MKQQRFTHWFSAPRLYVFLMKFRPFIGKYAFLLFCIVALIWYAVFTRGIIDRMQQDAVNVTRTYAELMRTAISEDMNYQQMNVIFEEIIQKSNNPIVVTDTAWRPIMWKNVAVGPFYNRHTIPPADTSYQARQQLKEKIGEYRKLYKPKPLYTGESQSKIGYLVFGNSKLVNSLKWMPILELSVVAAFIVFAYLAFHNIRVTERSNLWVGLARETAHQLGTPISSLMGWVEFMKLTSEDDDGYDPRLFLEQVQKICSDMERDLTRLRKIANRFNQIGSPPALSNADINGIIEDARQYLSMRLPLLRKKIEIRTSYGMTPQVRVNSDLLEWVLENLMKNAVDAIDSDDGLLELKTEYVEVDGIVRVQLTDNGRGIGWENQRKVFSPGYTTKKRGWGLGLTLAKRIVEDYHNGQIYVSWSQKGAGTTFCVDLPVKQKA